jgi:hypothetical protein
MTIEIPTGAVLSDPELLLEVRHLAAHERQATARSIAALGELDARRLYLGEGCSSAAPVFRTAEAGRGRPVPARRVHGSAEPAPMIPPDRR